jgi:pimeloyl-ACP methyl ester carboxylesterase
VPDTGLHVIEHGTDRGGPLVALLHGGMDRSTSFAGVLKRLPDLHVVAYDRRGYANSRHAHPTPGSIADHAADLLGLLRGRRAVAVGHSYGGDVALLAAVDQPGVVVAVGAFEPPMPWLPEWPLSRTAGGAALNAPTPEDAGEAFMRAVVGDDVWELLPERTRTERRAEGPALVAELTSITSAAPFDLAALRVPVVAGFGTAGERHHRIGVDHLLAAVPGAELFEINGAGHGAHVSHPDAFAAFVRTVVERAGS